LARGRPRDEGLAERRREEILEAATRVFAERSIRGTDVQEIANRVGVGKGTIYRYFPSKDELFLATVRRGLDALHGTLDGILREDAPPRARLEKVFRTFLGFFEERPELVEVLVQERAAFRERGRMTFFETCDAMFAGPASAAFQQELREAGILRHDPGDPHDRETVSEILYGLLFTTRFTGRPRAPGARTDAILDLLFHGLVHPEGET
jgi:AcrR family transcriptional regulator